MPSRRIKVLLVLGVITIVIAGTLFTVWYYAAPSKPSALITDGALSNKFHNNVLPGEYRILTMSQRWANDPGKGQFERSFECTILQNDNAPLDPKMVGERFEKWLSTLVKVTSNADDTASPADLWRVISYETERTTGEVRYKVKPVPDATLVVNDKESKGNFQSLEIQITEQRKR